MVNHCEDHAIFQNIEHQLQENILYHFLQVFFFFFFEIFIKLRSIFDPFKIIYTEWKVSKYGVFSGSYFPKFGLNISVFSPNAGKYGPEKTLYMDTFHAVLLEAFATLPTHINHLPPNTEYMSIFYFHHNLSHICY